MRTRSNGQRTYTAFQMIVQHRSISLKSLGFPWYPKDFLDIERFCGFPGLIGWGVGILFGSPHQTAKCWQKSLFFTCLCLGSPQYTFPAVRSIPERYAVAPELIWRWSPKKGRFFVANRGYLCSSSESGSYIVLCSVKILATSLEPIFFGWPQSWQANHLRCTKISKENWVPTRISPRIFHDSDI